MTRLDEDRLLLESERDFMLRSLADLEAERSRGEVTDDRFHQLADGYTARAAAISRTLERDRPAAGPDRQAPDNAPRRRRWGRAGVAAALIAAAAVAVVALPGALDDRRSDQTITDNAQSGEPSGNTLARAVEQKPDDPQTRLAYARFLLDDGELVEAVRQFDAVTRLDPRNAEALAYSGWIIALAGMSDAGLERLDAAVAADPGYPDAHLFRGMALLQAGNPQAAVPEIERYLELAPDGPLRAQAEATLAEAQRAMRNGSSPTR